MKYTLRHRMHLLEIYARDIGQHEHKYFSIPYEFYRTDHLDVIECETMTALKGHKILDVIENDEDTIFIVENGYFIHSAWIDWEDYDTPDLRKDLFYYSEQYSDYLIRVKVAKEIRALRNFKKNLALCDLRVKILTEIIKKHFKKNPT